MCTSIRDVVENLLGLPKIPIEELSEDEVLRLRDKQTKLGSVNYNITHTVDKVKNESENDRTVCLLIFFY